MSETLVRRDPITGIEVPRCDLPEDVVLRALRGKMHTVNIDTESSKEIVIEAMLRNFDADDITIDVEQGLVLIQAERYETKEDTKYSIHGSNSFYRDVTLPPGAQEDLITAHFQGDVLRVTVPLSEISTHLTTQLSRPRRIRLCATQSWRNLGIDDVDTTWASTDDPELTMTHPIRVLETPFTVPSAQPDSGH